MPDRESLTRSYYWLTILYKVWELATWFGMCIAAFAYTPVERGRARSGFLCMGSLLGLLSVALVLLLVMDWRRARRWQQNFVEFLFRQERDMYVPFIREKRKRREAEGFWAWQARRSDSRGPHFPPLSRKQALIGAAIVFVFSTTLVFTGAMYRFETHHFHVTGVPLINGLPWLAMSLSAHRFLGNYLFRGPT